MAVTARWSHRACCAALLLAGSITVGFAAEVDTLLQTPRQHPYLFFEADDIPAMRERLATEPWSQAAALILSSAEEVLSAEIPPEPDPGPDQPRDGFHVVLTIPALDRCQGLCGQAQLIGQGHADPPASIIQSHDSHK